MPMNTRRGFLKTAGVAPFAGVVPLCLPGLQGKGTATERQASRTVYAGKPLPYWLAVLDGKEHDPGYEESDLGVAVQVFGKAAVPRLIRTLSQGFYRCTFRLMFWQASPAMVQSLARALKHENPKVRGGVAKALYWNARFACERPGIVEALKEAMPALVDALDNENLDVAQKAAKILDKCGLKIDPKFPIPMGNVRDEDPSRRAIAVHRLRHYRGDAGRVIPVLVDRLRDRDASVRLAAARALSEFEPDHPDIVPVFVDYVLHRETRDEIDFSNLDRVVVKALPDLRKAMVHANSSSRCSIAHVLCWGASEAVFPDIVEMLDDDSTMVRDMALHAMIQFETTRIVPYFIRALRDEEAQVRSTVGSTMNLNPELALEALPDLIRLVERGGSLEQESAALVLKSLGKKAKEALPALRRNLKHVDRSVRLAAAVALVQVDPGSKRLAEILATGIDHPCPSLQAKVIDALESMGPGAKAALSTIIANFKKNLEAWQLCRLISAIGPDAAPAIPLLVELLKDKKPGHVPSRCVPDALASIGEKAIPWLVKLASRGPIHSRVRAARTIGLMGSKAKSTTPVLLDIVNTGPPLVQVVAISALGRIGSTEALPVFLLRLKDRDLAIRTEAVASLGKLGSHAESAIPDLAALLGDDTLNAPILSQVVATLRDIGPKAVPALNRALNHPDCQVRACAAKSLGSMEPKSRATVHALAKLLDDPCAGVRSSAAIALGHCGAEARPAMPRITRTLDDPVEFVRDRAKQALAAIEAPAENVAQC